MGDDELQWGSEQREINRPPGTAPNWQTGAEWVMRVAVSSPESLVMAHVFNAFPQSPSFRRTSLKSMRNFWHARECLTPHAEGLVSWFRKGPT